MFDAYRRYALFWVPAADDPLAAFGHDWTGWCAESGERRERRPIPGIGSMLDGLTQELALCGLHGVVAGPFTLRGPAAFWALETALYRITAEMRPFSVPGLRALRLGNRVALVCAVPGLPADRMVRRARVALSIVVEDGDGERVSGSPGIHPRPPEPRAADRFHLPLTDPVEDGAAARLIDALDALLDARRIGPVEVRDIALMGDPGEGRPFTVLRRYAFGHGAGGEADGRGPRGRLMSPGVDAKLVPPER